MPENFDWKGVLEQYRTLTAAVKDEPANVANEKRFQDILGVIGGTTETIGARFAEMKQLGASLGGSERERIGQAGQRAQATASQDLINRGLTNTTISQGVSRGIQEDVGRANRELTEQMSRQQMDIIGQQAQAEERQGNFLASMMEAKTERGPDAGLMASLMQQIGQGEGASGQTTINTGLSQNARAGRDVFGNTFGSATGGGGGGGSTYTQWAQSGLGGGSGTGGGGGGGVRIINRQGEGPASERPQTSPTTTQLAAGPTPRLDVGPPEQGPGTGSISGGKTGGNVWVNKPNLLGEVRNRQVSQEEADRMTKNHGWSVGRMQQATNKRRMKLPGFGA